MEAVVDSGQHLLDRIAVLRTERARLEAEEARLSLEFDDLRRRQAEVEQPDPRVRAAQASFAADELGVVTREPGKAVTDRLAQMRRARGVLLGTWEQFETGHIDAYRVTLIAAAAAKMRGDLHALVELDHQCSTKAPGLTTAQLKAMLRRLVARLAPAGASAPAEKARRGVWFDHQDDGMSFTRAYLSTADAVAIEALLNQRARAHADERTLDQRRVEEMVDLLLGRTSDQAGDQPGDQSASGSSAKAVIGVVVPVTTLVGLSDEPGEAFDGSFALPADLVRDLATAPGTLFYRILTDPLGGILDVTETGRFPSAKLRTAIEIRDGTCRFPTCSRPVAESDIDHHIPHPQGPTTGSNLRGLCRRHHNVKTYGIAEPTQFHTPTWAPSAAERRLSNIVIEYAPQAA